MKSLPGEPLPTSCTPVVEQQFHPKYECPSEPGCAHLRSSNVLFCVHRAILKSASGFFRTMLSLPQAELNSAGNLEPIEVSESPKVVEAFLSVATGRGLDMGSLKTVEDAFDILSAAEKYEMDGVVSTVRHTVLSPQSPFQDLPLKLAMVSHRYGWSFEYCIALERALSLNIFEGALYPNICALDGKILANITKYRYMRTERFRKLLLAIVDPNRISSSGCGVVSLRSHVFSQWKRVVMQEFTAYPSGHALLKDALFSLPEVADLFKPEECDCYQSKCSMQWSSKLSESAKLSWMSMLRRVLEQLPSSPISYNLDL